MENWRYDVVVDMIDGAAATVSNRGRRVLPTAIEVRFEDGGTQRMRLPSRDLAEQSDMDLELERAQTGRVCLGRSGSQAAR